MTELDTLNESLQTLSISDVSIVKPPLKWFIVIVDSRWK